MAGSAVFLAGMAAITSLQVVVAKYSQLSSELALATNLATAGIEELQITPYTDVVGTSICPVPPVATDRLACFFQKTGELDTLGTNPYYTRTWSATVDAAQQVTDITVTVTWFMSTREKLLFDANPASNARHQVVMRGRVYPK